VQVEETGTSRAGEREGAGSRGGTALPSGGSGDRPIGRDSIDLVDASERTSLMTFWTADEIGISAWLVVPPDHRSKPARPRRRPDDRARFVGAQAQPNRAQQTPIRAPSCRCRANRAKVHNTVLSLNPTPIKRSPTQMNAHHQKRSYRHSLLSPAEYLTMGSTLPGGAQLEKESQSAGAKGKHKANPVWKGIERVPFGYQVSGHVGSRGSRACC